jgi:hypothetical protein
MRSTEAHEKKGRRKGSDKVWVESTVLGQPMCYVQECAPRPGGSQPPVGLRLNIAHQATSQRYFSLTTNQHQPNEQADSAPYVGKEISVLLVVNN